MFFPEVGLFQLEQVDFSYFFLEPGAQHIRDGANSANRSGSIAFGI